MEVGQGPNLGCSAKGEKMGPKRSLLSSYEPAIGPYAEPD
jgi:hypothetical protein